MTPPREVPRVVGPNWANRFFEHLGTEYARIVQKPMDPRRFNAQDLGVLQTWFDRLKIEIDTYKITPSNIFNFDETGFRLGHGEKEAIITAYECNEIDSAGNRESITIIECINVLGKIIPPFIILAGKAHLEEWYRDLEDDYVLAGDKGYRLLLMDNCGAHLTWQFLDYCQRHQIICYSFPPHTTHMLQPLDSVPFQQYKHFHGKAVNRQAQLGANLTIKMISYISFIKYGNRPLHGVRSRQDSGIQAPFPTIRRGAEHSKFTNNRISLTPEGHPIFEESVNRLTEVNWRRSRKKTKRQVQVGGVLTVKDANRYIENRKIDEMAKNKKRIERERVGHANDYDYDYFTYSHNHNH
ncbi:hypothetical protein TSTA_020940 [Talaromyces stipitatus ATCC 10500]|uniref:DDE-1 domain-containing protein n=1 Tax=Talaromyces stipitatus (strain ATCC 10500 / CBS 375.48 / QM 6759 / NRRL 1006) TaxID=441959 RepID=B8MFP6_TALSN|nr:uncharacterized protein TSTA_020940 [Talaromyces stipitatus ATCC 10500]EED17036.1 hypothetical protein TSTA_020940 [Talaromyces stipitatus ATCC 10500]